MVNGWLRRLFGADADKGIQEEQSDGAMMGGLKREFAEHPSKDLTPERLYQILEQAEQGDLKAQHELFADMEEKDPQIAADMAKRRELAAQREWQIVAPDGANRMGKKAADFCAEVFGGIEVEDLIIDMGSAIGHGWVNLELPAWPTDGQYRYIEQPIFRPHSWFRLAPDDQDELRLRDMSGEGDPLWALGWVQHRHKAKAGYIARSGLHRVLAWPYLFQNYALGDLAQLLEIHGLPARIGRYPKGASPKEKSTLLRAVLTLGNKAAGIIPQGMAIEYLEAAKGNEKLFEAMMRWCEQAKSKTILGGILTSGTGDGTSTNALGNVHERSLASIIDSDARQYAGTIQRDLLWPLAAMNFGIEDRRRAPQFFLDSGDTEDYQTLAQALPIFVDLGARVPVWWLHERTRIPEASDGEEVLQKRQAPAASPPMDAPDGEEPAAAKATTSAHLAAAKSGDDALPADQLALDDLIKSLDPEDMQAQAEDLLAPIFERLDSDMAPEDVLGWLAEEYPRSDPGALEQMAAKLIWAAEMWGRLNAEAD